MTENIGMKIKQIREEKELTIDALAEHSTIHKSQIELIEKGDLMPSVATLVKLARALGTRVGTILDGEESPVPVVVHSQERTPTISISNNDDDACKHMNFFSLAQGKADRNMEPFTIHVGYCEPDAAISQHEGEEFFYVLEGIIVLHYGSNEYTLKKGDSIYFDSIVPHAVSTPAPGEKAKMLAVVYAPF